MTAAAGETKTFASAVTLARRRSFAGLALDGFDVTSALAAETDTRVLAQAFDTAVEGNEKNWAERFARRMCEIDDAPAAGLRLATILATLGRCREAERLLSTISAGADEKLYRHVRGVLDAKAGRIAETWAFFEMLPEGSADYPPPPVLTIVHEMIDQSEIAGTLAVVERLAAVYPAHLLIRALRLRCHLYAGNFKTARELAQVPDDIIQRATPYDRRAFVEAVADVWLLLGWMEQLFDFTRDRIAQDPTHWRLYDRAAISARATSRDKEYTALVDAIPADVRGSAGALAVQCRWHADQNRIEAARSILDELRPLSAVLFLEARLYLALQGTDQAQIDAALEACAACAIPLLGPTIGYAISTYYYNCTFDRLEDCLARLEKFSSSGTKHAHFWQTYLRCLIALGQLRRAEEIYRTLPPGLAKSAALGPFEMYFDSVHGRHASARKGWSRHVTLTRHTCVNARASYPQTIKLKYRDAADAVLLFVTLVDAMDYLDWFLAHYRALGVAHFFIIDNGSSDGTLQRLCEEDDVSVFLNRESFARASFGILWINHLMQRFGLGHWCFHVDSDEAFVFPGHGAGRTLQQLLSYCDQRGFGAVSAIQLDMYPERLGPASGDVFGTNCYFDTDYVLIPSELPPYVVIQGGIRKQLTGLAMSMEKMPLVRMAPDVRYIECNHRTTHLPMADVSGAVLHYKFIGNSRSRIEQAVSRGQYFGDAIAYRRLGNAIGSLDSAQSLLSSKSRRYHGAFSLEQHGLIRSSAPWDRFGPERNEASKNLQAN
jgi:hypothetical protein